MRLIVFGSKRSTRPDCVTTQSDPAANFNSQGVGSVATCFVIVFVAGSMRSSFPNSGSVTQTAPAAPATPHGVPGTATLAAISLPPAVDGGQREPEQKRLHGPSR